MHRSNPSNTYVSSKIIILIIIDCKPPVPHPVCFQLHSSMNLEENINDNSSIAKLRKEYSTAGIDENTLDPSNPLVVFQQWFDDACAAKVHEPNAMCLATANAATGAPSARIVLLKGFDERGFVWYTNYESRKGCELKENPNAALVFWWGELERSVRVEGLAEKVSSEESDSYFDLRPPKARLGAIESDQSRVISSREDLENKFKRLEEVYLNDKGEEKKKIERPQDWGGYRLTPTVIEFWKGRTSRIHDRIRYTLDQGTGIWTRERLQT